MNYIKALLITGMGLMFTACGGGGGTSDTPTVLMETPPIEYDLRTFIDKSSFTANMEGTINGVITQATIDVTYEGTVDYLGTTLDLHQDVTTMNGTTDTSYTGTYLGNVYGMEHSSGVTCEIVAGVTPTPVPTNATIGYKSDIVPLECSDGSSLEISGELLAGEGDNAILHTISKEYDAQGVLDWSGENFSTIDPSMNLLLYEVKIGEDIYFQSTSITQY